jgi:hypothetical protein
MEEGRELRKNGEAGHGDLPAVMGTAETANVTLECDCTFDAALWIRRRRLQVLKKSWLPLSVEKISKLMTEQARIVNPAQSCICAIIARAPEMKPFGVSHSPYPRYGFLRGFAGTPAQATASGRENLAGRAPGRHIRDGRCDRY